MTSEFGLWMTLSEVKFAPMSLTAVSVKVSIIDLLAEVDIVQSYLNNEETDPIETVYKLPIAKGTTVTKFSAEIDGREIMSALKETADENTDNHAAIRPDPSAFMMQENGLDVFMVKVGDVLAKSSTIIRLKYITELKMELGEIRFLLPWTIAPCYVPTEDGSTYVLTKFLPWKHNNLKVYYKLKFEASVSVTSGTIRDIQSPSHKIFALIISKMKRTVTIIKPPVTMDQDLILFVKVDNFHESSLMVLDNPEDEGAYNGEMMEEMIQSSLSCFQCGDEFSNRQHLKRHYRKNHPGMRPRASIDLNE